ncbi:hypothetical protein BDE02_07G129400 [Populus trichocarpa]|nr:hypothetical protein BDE02_07G129400 [Populus trichocarpa]
MLLICEARVQHHQQALLSAIPSANVATKQQSFSGSRVRNNNFTFRGRGRGPSSFHGRGNFQTASRPNNNYTNLWCQLCDKPGHTAARCFKRFDSQFLPQPFRPNPQANIASNQHIQHSLEQEWHADTGATHHLTNNFNNLNVRSEEYAGNDQIQVGDGTGLLGKHPA